MSNNESILDPVDTKTKNQTDNNPHPWRVCPRGQHLVRAHLEHIPPSKEHPEGHVITRHEHCAANPTHKDKLTFNEMQAMTAVYFHDLSGPPTPILLTKEFSGADKYDLFIRGWVQYWNSIFPSDDPLDPDLVKALIATESSFNQDIDKIHPESSAHGLMQITNPTLHILQNHNGELSDHLIHLTLHELQDPSANICAGVRWLFRKKVTAKARLHRTASWEEAVADYKSYLLDIISGNKPEPHAMQDLRRYLAILKGRER